MRDFLNGHGAVIGGPGEAAQSLLVRREAHGSRRRSETLRSIALPETAWTNGTAQAQLDRLL